MSRASTVAKETLELVELVLLKYPFILQCTSCEAGGHAEKHTLLG